MSKNIKILAEGAYSKIEHPFVFIAHSNETYLQLQNLIENLPPVSEIDFGKSVIVAAFAGTKNTGGYSVSIKNAADKVSIDAINPPKDAMVAQVITAPFQIARIAHEESESINLELSEDWKKAVQTYKITSGTFEESGGFAGLRQDFGAEGTIGVLSFDDYATFVFNLAGRGAQRNRRLTETASGSMQDGKIYLARLDAGSFSANPKPPLKISGTLINKKLSLVFEPLQNGVLDGFQARGRIEAVKIK